MAAETQYVANTGMVTISTSNANLDGTGTLGTVLTAASNGTIVKSITIKAQENTSQGMVRLFIYNGSSNRLIEEIPIPAVTRSATDKAFECVLSCEYILKSGDVLKASTEKPEKFNIIAEGLNWAYYSGDVRPESTNYTANTGLVLISTANTGLDGSGSMGNLITAASGTPPGGTPWKGCRIDNIIIKAITNTSRGMIRFFVFDGSTGIRLAIEVEVPAVTKSSTAQSFAVQVPAGFQLQAGYSLRVSTQNAESFVITAEGLDWTYPS